MQELQQPTVGGLGEVWIDRRIAERNEIRYTLVAIVLNDPAHRRIPIETVDLTDQGIGFFSPHGFIPGDYFAVRLHQEAMPSKLLLCQTMYAHKKRGGLYRIGAQFLESIPSESDLEIPVEWSRRARENKP